jgi:GT2 family glycosyltransferase
MPSDIPKKCDVFNGNCVLIPHVIAQTIGNIRRDFIQGGGDRDYGLRASQKGFSSYICPGYVGGCESNVMLEAWKRDGLTLRERANIVSNPARIHRMHDWMRFTRYYCKGIWPLFWARTYLRLWFPSLWVYFKLRSSSG